MTCREVLGFLLGLEKTEESHLSPALVRLRSIALRWLWQ